ncbi:MAG TPA: MFS transporter [Bryobacteraceae bacterium]|jgi:AAA family ATP:ADP antiporter
MPNANRARDEDDLLYRLLRKMIDVRPAEVTALAWSWLYFFSILSAYYVLRPIRDEIGAAGGVEKLPWLFMGTLIGMTIANPPFSALVSRLTPVRFISITYRFFGFNLLLFLVLLDTTTGSVNVWTGRIFYIWAAIFNLFVVSVFWGFMVDVFTNEQSRRLFGFIAAGGTIGGIAGSTLTSTLVGHVGRSALLLGSVVLLEVAVFGVRRLARTCRALQEKHAAHEPDAVVGGSIASGITHALKSPYLLNISLYMLLFTILSTFLYFQQADLAKSSFTNRATRTAFFANVDLAVNVLTLVVQLFLTGRIFKRLGVAVTLTLLPALSVAGFLLLGTTPTLWVIVVFQTLRRAGNFAVARPAREVLFTVMPREDKYKAKSFIDTFVYRAGDQIGAWSYALMVFLGLGIAGIGLAAVPISAAWLFNGLWLGRRQEKMSLLQRVEPVSVIAEAAEI